MKVSGFAFYCEWIKTNCVKKRRELKDDWVMDMKKLWNMLDKTSWKAVLYFIIASIAISISGTSTSMIAKYSVNRLLYHDDSAFIIIRNLLVLLIVSILIVILFRRFGYAELMKIRVSLENKVFKSVLCRRVDEQEQVNNGQIISNITQDVKVIISFLESDLPEVIEALVTALIMSIIVLYYNWIIFLLVLGLSAISSCSIFFSKKMYQFDQDILKQNDRGNTLLIQLYHSSAILHMYLGTKKMMEEYKKIAAEKWAMYPEDDAYAPEFVTIIAPTGITLREYVRNVIIPIAILITIIMIMLGIFGVKQIKIYKEHKADK